MASCREKSRQDCNRKAGARYRGEENGSGIETPATLALVLSVVGIYGVVSYAVAQRTHEIGVRMALGAQRTDVLKMVIRQGMVMSVGGVIVGVLGAVAATRLLSSWLYGIEATDPATFATVAVVLVGIALLATYIPARGAARVDPVNAMRSE